MKLFPKSIVVILLIALFLRIITALWSFNFRENTDVLRYRDWGRIAFLHGFSATYKQYFLSFGTLPNNQPPGSLYITSGMYNLWINTSKVILKITKAPEGSIAWVNGPLLNFFLRIPSIIADIVIGILIYLLVRNKSEKYALAASSLFLFNPVILYNSAFWGQMDSLNNAFFLLVLFILFKQKIEWVLPLFFLSLFIKLSLLPLLPILILSMYFASKENIFRIFKSIIYGFALIFLLTLPISSTPWAWIFSYFATNSLGEIQSITAFAFNFWWVIFRPTILIGDPGTLFSFSEIRLIGSPMDKTIYLGLTLFNWALLLFILFLLPIVRVILKKSNKIFKFGHLVLIFSIILVLVFLFLPRMHERYLYPVFPLLAIYFGLTKKALVYYLSFSLISFVNLYIVWHPMKIPILTHGIISNANFQWTMAIAIVFASSIFYLKSIKTLNRT